MAQKEIFWTIGEHFFYIVISYQRIKVYRVETINTGRYHCNNGVSGKILLEQWWQCKIQSYSVLWYLLYSIRYFGRSLTVLNDDTLMANF